MSREPDAHFPNMEAVRAETFPVGTIAMEGSGGVNIFLPPEPRPAYIATEEHMRSTYINSERRRNHAHGASFFQTDEEIGEEFDQGMARIRAELRAETLREAANQARDMPPMFDTDVSEWLDRLASIEEGKP